MRCGRSPRAHRTKHVAQPGKIWLYPPYKVELVSLKEARNREDLEMRILIASVAIALMMVSAHAQDMGKTRKHQHTQKTENSTKMKAADEQAYKEALKRIPDSTKKVDPWQNVR